MHLTRLASRMSLFWGEIQLILPANSGCTIKVDLELLHCKLPSPKDWTFHNKERDGEKH